MSNFLDNESSKSSEGGLDKPTLALNDPSTFEGTPSMDAIQMTAFDLACRGIRVFPVGWQSKSPILPGSWLDYATNDVSKIPQLFSRKCGIAVRLGPQSGILDMELDGPAAEADLEAIIQIYGDVPTVSYQSYRGIHRWYRWTPELMLHRKAVLYYRSIELRLGTEEKGAYSVAPPSLHESGTCMYRWLPGRAPWEVPIADFPKHLISLFAPKTSTSVSVVETSKADDGWLPEPGHRHAFALRLSKMLRADLRLPRNLVVEMMHCYNQEVGKTGEVAIKEIEDMVGSIKLPETTDQIFGLNFSEIYEAAKTVSTQQKKRDHVERNPIPSILPDWMEDFGWAAFRSQVPRNFWNMTLLTAVSAATGTAANVRYSDEAPSTGLQMYALGVGESGSGKSRALKTLLTPFTGQPSFCTNATTEALTTMLARNRRGVLLQVVEGRKFARMLGKYSQTTDGSNDNGVLLEAWSGDVIASVRQDEKKNVRIENPFLTVAATIQPHNLRNFSVDDVMEGLLQRLLVYGADVTPEDEDTQSHKDLAEFFVQYVDMINRVRSLRPNLYSDVIGSITSDPDVISLNCSPLTMVLDDQASTRWKEYARWKRSADNLDQYPEEHPYRTDMARHAEVALRMAGILYLTHAASTPESWESANLNHHRKIYIPLDILEKAIEWQEWQWSEKQNLTEDLVEDRYFKAMPQRALKAIQSLPEAMLQFAVRRQRTMQARFKEAEWTARDYYRYLRLDAEQAHEEIVQLLSAGLIQEVRQKAGSPVYTFTEKVLQKKPSRFESR